MEVIKLTNYSQLIEKAADCVDGIAQTGAIQHCSSGENIFASHG